MALRFVIEFLKWIAIIIGVPLATWFVTFTVAYFYWLLFNRNEDPLGVAIVAIWSIPVGIFIALVMIIRRIADIED